MSEPNKSRSGSGKVQGEGDYEAARRYREGVSDFVKKSDVDGLASKAEPSSAKEAREMALADERARARSKGDDPVDMEIMYDNKQRKV